MPGLAPTQGRCAAAGPGSLAVRTRHHSFPACLLISIIGLFSDMASDVFLITERSARTSSLSLYPPARPAPPGGTPGSLPPPTQFFLRNTPRPLSIKSRIVLVLDNDSAVSASRGDAMSGELLTWDTLVSIALLINIVFVIIRRLLREKGPERHPGMGHGPRSPARRGVHPVPLSRTDVQQGEDVPGEKGGGPETAGHHPVADRGTARSRAPPSGSSTGCSRRCSGWS